MPQTNLERRKMQLGMISQPQIEQPQNYENEVFDWLPDFLRLYFGMKT